MLFLQRGAEDAGQIAHILGHQEVGAHEGFHRPARLFGIDIAQLGRQCRLHVELQAFLGAPQQVMQAHAHVPQERFGLLEGLVFLAGEDAMLDQAGGVLDMIKILADPVEGLQVAQAPLAFLDVGLDQIAAFALALMALLALGQLGFDKVAAIAGGDFSSRIWCAVLRTTPRSPTDSALPGRRCGW